MTTAPMPYPPIGGDWSNPEAPTVPGDHVAAMLRNVESGAEMPYWLSQALTYGVRNGYVQIRLTETGEQRLLGLNELYPTRPTGGAEK